MITDKQQIVCGTDFSAHAAEAADVAAAIAKRLGDSLVLIHAIDDSALGVSYPEIYCELFARDRERLLAEAERLRKSGAEIVDELIAGSPSRVLPAVAERKPTRLLVVSSLGHVAPSRFFAGSVAERTAETASVPTLVMRKGGALAAWARGGQHLRVVVAHDFSPSADAALAWVKQLQQIGPCEIAVVHVDWPPTEMQRLGVSGPISLIENPPTIARVLERDLHERVTEVLGGQAVTLRVAPGWGRTDAHIIHLAQAEQADLLVVGSHQRHGLSRLRLGSVSRGVLHHAPMSVAVVPTGIAGQPEASRIPEFHRVLVTTDFSNVGNRAIPFACAALRRGGTVHLLHVVEQGGLPTACHELTAQLRALIPTDAEAHGIKAEVEVTEGHEEFRSICQAAERFGADLICTSSHGRTGIAKALLGSVAQAVMAHTQRPALIVPRPVS